LEVIKMENLIIENNQHLEIIENNNEFIIIVIKCLQCGRVIEIKMNSENLRNKDLPVNKIHIYYAKGDFCKHYKITGVVKELKMQLSGIN